MSTMELNGPLWISAELLMEGANILMSNKIRVIVVDDDTLIRNGLALAIDAEADMEVVATSQNGLEAIQKAMESKPDLILMDIQMPIMNGIDAIQKIREFDHHVIILILTTFNEDEYVIEGLAQGANGYLLKKGEFTQLLQSIRDAVSGQYFLPVEVAAKLVNYLHNK